MKSSVLAIAALSLSIAAPAFAVEAGDKATQSSGTLDSRISDLKGKLGTDAPQTPKGLATALDQARSLSAHTAQSRAPQSLTAVSVPVKSLESLINTEALSLDAATTSTFDVAAGLTGLTTGAPNLKAD